MLKPIDESRIEDFEVEWTDSGIAAYVRCGQKNILTFYDHGQLSPKHNAKVTVARPHVLDLVLDHADNNPDLYTDKMVDLISNYIDGMDTSPSDLRETVNRV